MNYRHQVYSADVPRAPYELLEAEPAPPPGSQEFQRRMAEVSRVWRNADVRRVYLVHGTFAGRDALGILGELGRIHPRAANWLGIRTKQLIDAMRGDRANFTRQYAEQLERALALPGEPDIEVRLFHWSSENHHLGRASGAVQLLEELARWQQTRPPQDSGRALLWGHSHGGNVLALASHLLAGDQEFTERFFQAALPYYRSPLTGEIDKPQWQQIRQRLGSGAAWPACDMVSLGTPVRYGWNTQAAGRLAHIAFHRPSDGLPGYRGLFPPRIEDVRRASGGDYVHLFAIAGTNTLPSTVAWRAMLADQRLHCLLQPGVSKRDLWQRLCLGVRVHDAGDNYLVDFGLPEGSVVQHAAGHAVYTRLDQLLLHSELVARTLAR